MSRAIRSFGSKDTAHRWIERCKRELRGCTYGTVYAMNRGGHYHAYVSGDFTEKEARATVPNIDRCFFKYVK